MIRITVDPTTRAKLKNLQHRLEICDETGRVLGYFNPAVERSVYEGVDSPTSEEELRRRESQGGGRTLSDIFSDLERRG